MALDEYSKKRDFNTTPEPGGKTEENKSKLRFVVQRHDASRLHYDLRLEMEGVLKSWAVPKGPSMNPADKRLAIHTEDHPIKYLDFEGIIPKGNYGAGEMVIWDRGTFTSASKKTKDTDDLVKGLEKGDLKIMLSGKKLKGEFALVSMKKENQWLLIKKKDEFSIDLDYDAEDLAVERLDGNSGGEETKSGQKSLNLTDMIKPMMATKTKEIFEDPEWIYEKKWDGYRAVANISDGEVRLYSRNGISFNKKFAAVVEGLKTIPQDAILDGEIVFLDKKGKPQFQMLQNYSPDDEGELVYYVFDLLHLNGHDTTGLTLEQRKSLLPDVLGDAPNIAYSEHINKNAAKFFKQTVEDGMEGVIAKKANSKYHPGARSRNWLKIKSNERQEAIICGYTEGKRLFGSLVLGMYEDDKLKYIGNCGSGFDEDSQREILKILKPLEIKDNPFGEKINLKGRKATWVKPEIICEIVFSEWTESESIRHPVFKGLRSDKSPTEITKEKEVMKPSKEQKKKEQQKTEDKKQRSPSPQKNKNKSKIKGSNVLEIEGISVPVTNLDKVYWPDEGYTKYDLIDYYVKMADVIMPYLVDRPQNLNRHPNGIYKEGFYQKDSGGILPDWIETIGIYSESSEKEIEYMLCQNTAALVYMANLGCIEINPWNSNTKSLDNPDYTVIDIDPSSKSTFEEVIEVAQATKEVLDKAKIVGYCKTSGSRGMHVYLPLEAKYTYDEARDFTKLLCYYINEELPELTTMERSLKKRKDRIYLDYLQNRSGQTLAAPYCLRPKTGATASAPLKWSEVKSGLDMKDFNIHTMPERIKSMKDPFKKVLGKGIDIEKALKVLGEEG
ncbi:MAG: DNA ligase D [Balneolaceae bacterium]